MRRLLTVALGLLLLGATALPGQSPDRSSGTAKRLIKPGRASNILGAEVSVRGGAVGKVTDIVIGEDGRVDYLVVNYAGDLLAVPWAAVRYVPGERSLSTTTTVPRDRLRDVTFEEKDWPDFYSERWIRTARSVWGERTIREPGPEPAMQQPRYPLPPPNLGARPPRRSDPSLPGGTGHTEDRQPPR